MLLVYSLSVSFIVTVLLQNAFETLKIAWRGSLEVSPPVAAPDALLLARRLDSDKHDRVANYAISSSVGIWRMRSASRSMDSAA